MTLLVVISFFLLLYFFSYFTGKINKLEKEISDLKKILNPEKEVFEEIKAEFQEPKTQELSPEKLFFENSEITEKKAKNPDWTDVLFSFIRQNFLTIIGIFTLVLGIGYFVKYAIDKNWIGETMRFLIGIFVGFTIILAGYFIRKKYGVFSAIITGGGLAVLFMSITLAFQEYHLFSQNLAFFFLILTTILSVAIAYLYDSEVLIIFALIGGFGAPLMVSTGHSNYPFLFTYLSLLNLGMLVIAFLKSWKSIGWFSFFATSAYVFLWISDKTETLSLVFICIFYLIFYAFALRNYFKKEKIGNEDIILLVITNFASVVGITYIFQTLNLEPLILFPLIFAGINALLWFYEAHKRKANLFPPIFMGIMFSLITIAVALQFKTHLITTIWAIESVLLLYFWTKTNENVFKKSFDLLLPLVLIAEVVTWLRYDEAKQLQPIFNSIFLTGLVVSLCLGIDAILIIQKNRNRSKDIFDVNDEMKLIALANLFLVGLLEIIYQLQNQSVNFIWVSTLLYSTYFVFAVLFLNKILKLKLGEKGIIFLILILGIAIASIPYFIDSLQKNEFSYLYYLLYLVPVIFAFWKSFKKGFLNKNFDFWLVSSALIYLVCFEISHFYLFSNSKNLVETISLQNHFNIFYLPMIWTVLAIIFIFIGIKNQISEFSRIGFFLIVLMSIKLYLYDVWRMDNISRIIAFIILGIILLSSSFTFQKLKEIIKNMMNYPSETQAIPKEEDQ